MTCSYASGMPRLSTCWSRDSTGQLRPRRHDPLRVRAGEVGVGVDHLGLEPQPELHAQLADAVDERVQAVGPDVGGDDPVAEARAVVAAGAEPAVVEHEALHADRGRAVGEVEQPVAVVVEVDGLPDVQRDRALGRDRPRPGPQVAVEAAGDLVEPVAVRAVEPRARVGLVAGRAGPRRAAAARRRRARARRCTRARRSGRGCRSRPCAPPRPDPRRSRNPRVPACRTYALSAPVRPRRFSRRCSPVRNGAALRHPLLVVAAREVEQLVGVGGHREGEGERRRARRAPRARLVTVARARAPARDGSSSSSR